MTEKTYNSIWGAIYENEPEKAADFKTLSRLALKYRDEVQLFFGSEQQFSEMEMIYSEFNKTGDY